MDAITKVIRGWRDAGIALNPPATAAAMSKLAKVLDEAVPSDLQRFYGVAFEMSAPIRP